MNSTRSRSLAASWQSLYFIHGALGGTADASQRSILWTARIAEQHRGSWAKSKPTLHSQKHNPRTQDAQAPTVEKGATATSVRSQQIHMKGARRFCRIPSMASSFCLVRERRPELHRQSLQRKRHPFARRPRRLVVLPPRELLSFRPATLATRISSSSTPALIAPNSSKSSASTRHFPSASVYWPLTASTVPVPVRIPPPHPHVPVPGLHAQIRLAGAWQRVAASDERPHPPHPRGVRRHTGKDLRVADAGQVPDHALRPVRLAVRVRTLSLSLSLSLFFFLFFSLSRAYAVSETRAPPRRAGLLVFT